MTNWPVVPLRDVAEISAGITLGRKTKETDLVSVPYLRVANVQDGSLDLSEIKTVQATRREIEKWRLRDGDLLLTEGGDLDKLGRGTCWREQLPLCIHQNHIFRVRFPVDRYDPDFVSLQIGSGYGKAYFFAHAKKTTGIASINQQVLGSFPLLSPPLEQQQCIAAHLKVQLAAVEEARQAAQAQLDEAGLLTQAILRDVFLDLADTPQVTIVRIADIQLGKMLSPNAKTGKASFPYLRNQNVQWGRIDVTDLAEMDFSEREREKFSLRKGDLLICEGGEPGRCAVWQGTVENCYYQKALHRVRPHEGFADSEFLYLWIRHQADIGSFKDQNAKTTIAHLPLVRLEQFLVPDLSLPEQRKVAQELKVQLAAAEEMRQAAQAQLDEIKRLPGRLLAQAFDSKEDMDPD